MTFVCSTQEQRGVIKIETCVKKLDIKKSNVTKVKLVFFTASMLTIEMVETCHDKTATRHDGDSDGNRHDGNRHDGSQY
eukprot:1857691-Ditylum_brightwellii.AAC.1